MCVCVCVCVSSRLFRVVERVVESVVEGEIFVGSLTHKN